MSLFDDDYEPLYIRKPRGYVSPHDQLTQEKRLEELNNMDRTTVTEDFEDSNFADRL